ncbi:MAG: hypothetical protein HQ582_13260 [Planctomycetes bacterium]|nr:hypothetical protein [Planctomycetota bacterium]
MNPGTGTICRDCDNLICEAFDQGHANPCKLNRWEGTRHLSPDLAESGRSCGGFEPRAEEPVDKEAAVAAVPAGRAPGGVYLL